MLSLCSDETEGHAPLKLYHVGAAPSPASQLEPATDALSQPRNAHAPTTISSQRVHHMSAHAQMPTCNQRFRDTPAHATPTLSRITSSTSKPAPLTTALSKFTAPTTTSNVRRPTPLLRNQVTFQLHLNTGPRRPGFALAKILFEVAGATAPRRLRIPARFARTISMTTQDAAYPQPLSWER